MVRVQQPGVGRDDAVAVGVGVVAGGDGELVLAARSGCHGVGRRAVHPDLAVPVEGHERERRVDVGVDHGQVEAVALADRAPVVPRSPRRAGRRRCVTPARAIAARSITLAEIVDVGGRGSRLPVVAAAAPGRTGPGARPSGRRSEQLVRPVLDLPVMSVPAGPPSGGLYLKPPSARRVVRGRDDDPVGQRGPGARGCAPGSRGTRPASACTRRRRRPCTLTPLAASTSSALTCAGSESACVSAPRNSGPSIPCAARYSQIAWVMARMWSSLNVAVSADRGALTCRTPPAARHRRDRDATRSRRSPALRRPRGLQRQRAAPHAGLSCRHTDTPGRR